MPTPAALAREKIDAILIAAGWAVRDFRQLNLRAARGLALREVPGRCDFRRAQRIVAEVERRVSVIDELEMLASANLAPATSLRSSILIRAFNPMP